MPPWSPTSSGHTAPHTSSPADLPSSHVSVQRQTAPYPAVQLARGCGARSSGGAELGRFLCVLVHQRGSLLFAWLCLVHLLILIAQPIQKFINIKKILSTSTDKSDLWYSYLREGY